MSSGRIQRSQSLTQLPSTTPTAPTSSSSKIETSKSTIDIKSTTTVKDSSTSTPIQSESQQVQSSILSSVSSDVRSRSQRLRLPISTSVSKEGHKWEPPTSSKGFLENIKGFFRWIPTSKDKSILQSAKGFFAGISYTARTTSYDNAVKVEMQTLSRESGKPVSYAEAEKSLKSKKSESQIKLMKSTTAFEPELQLQHLLVMHRNPMASAQSKEDAILYEAFCEKEFSSENTHFLKETMDLADIGRRDGAESQAMRDKMKFLFTHSIRQNSSEEINLPFHIRSEAQSAYEHLLMAEAYKSAVETGDTEKIDNLKPKLLAIQFQRDPQVVALTREIGQLEAKLKITEDPNVQRDLQLQISAKKHEVSQIQGSMELHEPDQVIEAAQTRLGASIQDSTTEIYRLSKDTFKRFTDKYESFKSDVKSTKQGRIWNEFKKAHKNWWSNRHNWSKTGMSGVKQDFSNFFKSWGKFNKAILNVYFFNTMPESDGITKDIKEAKVAMKKQQQWPRGVIDGSPRKRPEDYQDTFARDLQRLL